MAKNRPDISDAQILAVYDNAGSFGAAARMLGLHERTIARRMAGMRKKPPAASAIEIPPLPSGELSAEELLDRRAEEFERRNAYESARKLIPIKVRDDKPIGVLFFGDPHLDDAGCDIRQLRHDVDLVKATDGLYGVSIGDNLNNWIGRLAHLWGQQETTSQQSWVLVEWFVRELTGKWLFMVGGNHDAWSGDGDPLRWMQRQAKILEAGDAVRVALKFPNGREVRIAARHNWPGNSIWNANHGQLRAAYLQVHDHLIVGGHKHSGGDQTIYVEAADLVARALQLGSYKIHDSYAKQIGFIKTQIAPSCLAIIDPHAKHPAGLTHLYYDTALGAELLTAVRARKARK